MIVREFLNKSGRKVSTFKNNLPGIDWVNNFVARYKHLLSTRMCQNITKKRAEISTEVITKFFDNIANVLQGVPATNIINYDETNFTNDPGKSRMIFRRGIKYPERVMNFSKTSYSVMFAGTASGELLPPYVVYKGMRLKETWTEGGPHGCRYNVSKSGWFDADTFYDWFKTLLLPFCKNLQGHKVVIGDNLSSHLHQDVFQLCNENNISFVFLPPNSTHLLQPLDVVFYAPLKRKWRETLTNWKKTFGKNIATLPKDWFPRLLSNLLHSINNEVKHNMSMGFQATGLYPLDRERVLRKLRRETTQEDIDTTRNFVSHAVLDKLLEIRSPPTEANNAPKRRKAITLTPGKSHTGPRASTSGSATTQIQKKQGANVRRELQFDKYADDEENELESNDGTDLAVAQDMANPQDEMQEPDKDISKIIVNENDFILVRFKLDGKVQREKFYVARVREQPKDDDCDVMVEFLKKSSDTKKISFVYPVQHDMAAVERENIRLKLTLMSTNRGKHVFTNTMLSRLADTGSLG
ncbi:hypothetical protein HAZT_HAZT010418 [Hyalella azteca]|uniref:DDE-1 domain-containing protein n=1 Tax=Hyalella azteca TaxID=294128 RepID=A0A6A0H763_HYAAZ|nr:hypothetical protein HAZT_HAZT010418 [Hyalella azteca]